MCYSIGCMVGTQQLFFEWVTLALPLILSLFDPLSQSTEKICESFHLVNYPIITRFPLCTFIQESASVLKDLCYWCFLCVQGNLQRHELTCAGSGSIQAAWCSGRLACCSDWRPGAVGVLPAAVTEPRGLTCSVFHPLLEKQLSDSLASFSMSRMWLWRRNCLHLQNVVVLSLDHSCRKPTRKRYTGCEQSGNVFQTFS